MKISRPYDNDIVVVNNLINDEDCNYISYWVEKLYPLEDRSDYIDEINKINNILENTHELIKQIMVQEFEYLDNPFFSKFAGIVIKPMGEQMDPHVDGYPGEEEQPVNVGAIYYINDTYSGGEIYYPNLNIEHTPIPNSLVIHPGEEMYMHGVKKISDGIRLSLTAFAFNDFPKAAEETTFNYRDQ